MKKLKIYFLLVATLSVNFVFGQKFEEEFELVRPYRPILADAVKIRSNPDFNDITINPQPQSYLVMVKRLSENSQINFLGARNYTPTLPEKLAPFYAKLGYGNFAHFLGEVYISSQETKNTQYGASFRHYQAQGNLENQNLSIFKGEAFGRFTLDQNSINAGANFSSDEAFFYGYDNTVFTFSADDVRKKYTQFGADISIKNFRNTDFNYELSAKFYDMKDNQDAAETNLDASVHLNKKFSKFNLGANINLDINEQLDVNVSSNSFVRAQPYIAFKTDKFKLKAGVNVVQEFGDVSNTNIFPVADIDFSLIDEFLNVYGGISGNVYNNSLKNLSDKNRFLRQGVTFNNTREKLFAYGGIRGSLANLVGIKGQITYSELDNMPFYLNDPGVPRTFFVLYDSGTKWSFLGELSFQKATNYNLTFTAQLFSYDLDFESRPWHEPTVKLNANGDFKLTNKIRFGTEVLFVGERFAKIDFLTNDFVTLPSFTDISANISYQINSKFSAYLNANNLLNKSYQKFLNYNNFGLNLLGGLSLKF